MAYHSGCPCGTMQLRGANPCCNHEGGRSEMAAPQSRLVFNHYSESESPPIPAESLLFCSIRVGLSVIGGLWKSDVDATTSSLTSFNSSHPATPRADAIARRVLPEGLPLVVRLWIVLRLMPAFDASVDCQRKPTC